jgi:hypothetical protein
MKRAIIIVWVLTLVVFYAYAGYVRLLLRA